MKRKFEAIAKKLSVKLTDYDTGRSNMGVQWFTCSLANNEGHWLVFEDGYHIGSGEAPMVVAEFTRIATRLSEGRYEVRAHDTAHMDFKN